MAIVAQADLENWNSVQLQYQHSKKIQLSSKYECRFNNNITEFKNSLISVGLNYKLQKKIFALAEYRLSTNYQKDQHRFGIGINCHFKVKKWQVIPRVLIQKEQQYFDPEFNSVYIPKTTLRGRIQMRHKIIKKTEAYFSSEIFYTWKGIEKGFKRMRNIVGINYNILKNMQGSLAYFYQPYLGNYPRSINYVVFAGLQFEIEGKLVRNKKGVKKEKKNVKSSKT